MTSTRPRVRLVILFGGRSAEHEVSCMSALHVLRAADPDRYEPVAVGITRDGRWVDAGDVLGSLGTNVGGTASLPSPDDIDGPVIDPLAAIGPATAPPPIVVMPLLHGPMGEDGTVQGLLELARVPYVGAGVLGSALCMDKGAAKDVLANAGLPQARWLTAREPDAGAAFVARVRHELGLPCFVKPANLGSSVGVTKAHDHAEVAGAIAEALRYDEYVVVEEAIIGREIEVGVLGNDDPRASVPGEIVPSRDFYDFDDKYVAGAAELRVPAPLSADAAKTARSLAVAAFKALRVDGMARVDFFYEEHGRGFLVNELNTIPGFTSISMYPKLWAASGLSYPALVDELVRLALERHTRRQRFSTKR